MNSDSNILGASASSNPNPDNHQFVTSPGRRHFVSGSENWSVGNHERGNPRDYVCVKIRSYGNRIVESSLVACETRRAMRIHQQTERKLRPPAKHEVRHDSVPSGSLTL